MTVRIRPPVFRAWGGAHSFGKNTATSNDVVAVTFQGKASSTECSVLAQIWDIIDRNMNGALRSYLGRQTDDFGAVSRRKVRA